ncbi:MAG: BTAD domain-containing putative transcriptional regulator [Gemmatimonadaceae bacterium]
MYTLRMLGGIGLSDAEGGELDALLRQPKHLALLSYLAMPRPGTWHRRDSLLVTFWPELDQGKARPALRRALYVLRGHLVDGAIRSRGDDEVSLDPALITTDVAALAEDLSAGRHAYALARYAGDLLPGLHIPDAEEFEKWLGNERSRLKKQALNAAVLLAESRERSGDIAGAVDAARRCSELNPDDEVAARRWITLLDRAGDRSQAFAVYERFRDHVAEEFGVRPSAETVALLDAVRTRRDLQTTPAGASSSKGVSSSPQHSSAASRPIAETEAGGGVLPFAAPAPSSTTGRQARPRLWFAVVVTGFAAAIVVFAGLRRQANTARAENTVRVENTAGTAAEVASSSRSLVVLPMENETGDPKQAYLAAGLAEGVARRLEGMGGLTVRSGARSEWPAATRHDLKAVGRQFGSNILLKTTLARRGGSFEVRAAVLDVETSGEKHIPPRRFTIAGLRTVESELAAAVAGEIFRVPMPAVPRVSERAINPESYRLMLEGFYQQMTIRNHAAAKRLFEKAVAVDPSNSRAWAGLTAAWTFHVAGERIPFDVGYNRASAAGARALALDSLEGTAWASLGLLRAMRYRNLAIGFELIQKAKAVEPGNAQIFEVENSLYRSAWRWDSARDAIRFVRQLDPLNSYYLDREAATELCAGLPHAALKLYEAELVLNPSDTIARAGQIRSFARMSRYDDAIVAWRILASDAGDTALARALARASGDEGYWSAKRLDGRRKLEKLQEQGKRGWTSPLKLMQLRFESGDIYGGYRELELLAAEKDPNLFRLPCMPGVDVVRGTPRFEAIMARVGPMPLR